MNGAAAVHMIVRRHEANVLTCAGRPDFGLVEHPQCLARRQVHRHPKPANHRVSAKGGRVYPCAASSERTPSSAFPCSSTASARRPFASIRAWVVRRFSKMRNATTAPASSHGRIAFLNSSQKFIHTSGSRRSRRRGPVLCAGGLSREGNGYAIADELVPAYSATQWLGGMHQTGM